MSKKTTTKKRTTQKTNNKDKEYAAQYLSQNLKMPKEEIAKELNIKYFDVPYLVDLNTKNLIICPLMKENGNSL